MFRLIKRLWNANSSVAEERGEESIGGTKRGGSQVVQKADRRNTKAASKEGRQPSKGKLSSKDGGSKGSRKGREGKANPSSSQLKSVGSIKQTRRKSKSQSNKPKKQIKKTK